ncbi:MAG: endolytic transglycosylase MltG [Acidiferrobacterales bacterium]|nr:endolytic transglycosylase MltG [Acidiferrobacterales bacterium]
MKESWSRFVVKPFKKMSVPMRLVSSLPFLGVFYLLLVWNWPLDQDEQIHAIPPGHSLSAITRQLNELGVLPDRISFQILARLTGATKRIQAGEYRFKSGMNERDILSALVQGRQVKYSLRLIEGSTFADFLQLLASQPKLEQTLTGLKPSQIMQRLSYGNQYPEGRFFPDTYTYTAGTKDIDILRQAYVKMQKVLQTAWNDRADNLPYKTPYEALIMASIVEKETGRPEDRDRIAAVFVNRLRRNMRLQTDPTVIYGMGSQFDGNLRKRDLQRDTPYNTYTRKGLPPTPISLPGRDAIHAALHPAPTNDLYFVSRGDGTSEFSENYLDHNRAVRKYQLGK